MRRKTRALPESPMDVRTVTKEPYKPHKMALTMTIRAEAVERLLFILDDPHMAPDKLAPVDSYELIVVQRPACGAQNSLMIRKAFVKRTASAFPFGTVL